MPRGWFYDEAEKRLAGNGFNRHPGQVAGDMGGIAVRSQEFGFFGLWNTLGAKPL